MSSSRTTVRRRRVVPDAPPPKRIVPVEQPRRAVPVQRQEDFEMELEEDDGNLSDASVSSSVSATSSVDADIDNNDYNVQQAASAYLLGGPRPVAASNKETSRAKAAQPSAQNIVVPPPNTAAALAANGGARRSPSKWLSPVVEAEEPMEQEEKVSTGPSSPLSNGSPVSPRDRYADTGDDEEGPGMLNEHEMDILEEEQGAGMWSPSVPGSLEDLATSSSRQAGSKHGKIGDKRGRRRWLRIFLWILSIAFLFLALFMVFAPPKQRRTLLRFLTDFQDASAKSWTQTRRGSLKVLERFVG